jgi:uncharacterized protein
LENRKAAQIGLKLLKEAILNELASGPLSNSDLVHRLDIPSDFEGENRNYLSWSILGLLVGEGLITYQGERQNKVYFLTKNKTDNSSPS